MIDIMLVLLSIFKIVTPLIAAGFQATMPRGSNLDPRPEEEGEVVLGIDVNGDYYLDGRRVQEGGLEDILRSMYTAREEDKILFFKADRSLRFEKIEEAVEIARRAGARVMAAITEPQLTSAFGDEEE